MFKSYAEDGQGAQTEAAEPQAESAPAPAAEPAPAPAAEPASEPAASPAPAADADEAAPSEDAAPAEELAEEEPAETEEEATDEEASRRTMKSAAPMLGAPNDETTDESTASGSSSAVYVDADNGDDENDGSSTNSAVKTWNKVSELIGDTVKDVFVKGVVDITGTITTNGGSVKRTEGYDGTMFRASGETNFKDIVLDGEEKEAKDSAIKTTTDTELNFLKGTIVQGMKAAIGAVATLNENNTVLVDGATFKKNEANQYGALFFASDKNVDVTIRSGIIEENKLNVSDSSDYWKGLIYHNRRTSAINKLNIYNAAIHDNTSGSKSAVMYICGAYSTAINNMNVDGVALYNNTVNDIKQESSSGSTTLGGDTMLGNSYYHLILYIVHHYF